MDGAYPRWGRHRAQGDAAARRWLRSTAWVFLVAWMIHTVDHIRRGTDAITTEVAAAGAIGGVVQLAAIAAVLRGIAWGPRAAAPVGLASALGIALVHGVPGSGGFSDAFPGAVPGSGVTALSWFAMSLELMGAVAFGAAGLLAVRVDKGSA